MSAFNNINLSYSSLSKKPAGKFNRKYFICFIQFLDLNTTDIEMTAVRVFLRYLIQFLRSND